MEKYSIIREVGRGSFATVYLAEDKYTGKQVALKRACESNREAFAREIELMKKCDSPFVIRFIDGVEDRNRLIMVQEFANFGTLDQLVESRQSTGSNFTEEEIWQLLTYVLLGISDIHLVGVCHKDIKAQNVFLHKQQLGEVPNKLDFVCKIGDFGISIDFSYKQNRGVALQPATPAYMSPELLENQPFSQKTDIWSAGVLAYYLATFAFPFPTVEDVLYRRAPDLSLKGCSAKLAVLIGRMLCFNYKLRPSIEELLEAKEIRLAAQEFLPPHLFQQYFPKSVKFSFLKPVETSETSKSGLSRAQTPKISEKEQRGLTDYFAEQQTLDRIPGRRISLKFRFAALYNPEARKSILTKRNTILCVGSSGADVFWLDRDYVYHDVRDYNGIKHFFTYDDFCVLQRAVAHAAVFVFDSAKVMLTRCGLKSVFLYLEGSTFLSLAYNAICKLDLADCYNLRQLDVSGNSLRRLQTSGLAKLEVLNAEANELCDVDFSSNARLKIAYLQRNRLYRLVCGAALRKLNVAHNVLKFLDLTAAEQLEMVQAAGNRLQRIIFARSVTVLNVSDNLLNTFLIPENASLISLDLSRNRLSGVDFSLAKQLRRVAVWDNAFLELRIEQNAMLSELLCWGNKCEALVLHSGARFYTLQVNSNRIEQLTVPSCEQAVLFGNRLFHVQFADPARILGCDLSFNRLTELSFDGFCNLITLNVSNNQLRRLELSLPRLRSLFCQSNRLEVLRLRGCLALQRADASGNRLSSVDFDGCGALYELDLSFNRLERLDLHKCVGLTTCIVRRNYLYALDVSFNVDLSYLDACGNRLKTLIHGDNKVLQVMLLEGNYLYTLQPNRPARPTLGGLQLSDHGRLRQLNISGTQVPELVISALPALECVGAQRAMLFRVDVRSCPRLISLNAEKNRIASVVFKDCQALRFLMLRGNKLARLDCREIPRLQWLDASFNELAAVDFADCRLVQTIYLADNALTRLELVGFPSLRRFSLSGNRLCDCSVVDCPLLAEVDITRNYLTSVPKIDAFRVCMRYNAVTSTKISELCARVRVLEIDATEMKLENVALEQLFVHADRLSVVGCPKLCLIESNNECVIECDDDRVLLARR